MPIFLQLINCYLSDDLIAIHHTG